MLGSVVMCCVNKECCSIEHLITTIINTELVKFMFIMFVIVCEKKQLLGLCTDNYFKLIRQFLIIHIRK